jgi:hypothetical protein
MPSVDCEKLPSGGDLLQWFLPAVQNAFADNAGDAKDAGSLDLHPLVERRIEADQIFQQRAPE